MNHIIAALYVIGIFFAIWAGFDHTASLTDVEATLAEIDAAMAELATVESPAEVAEQVITLGAPLRTLISDDTRLPRGLQIRLEALESQVEDVINAAISDLAEPESAALMRLQASTAIKDETPVEKRLKVHLGVLEGLTQETPGEQTAISEELSSVVNALCDSWDQLGDDRDLTGVRLTAASLSAQGNLLFIKFADFAEISVTIAISLIGIMALWLGIMRVAEEAGLIQMLAAAIRPILHFLFPKVPKNHPAEGAVMMSMAANILGLDNAATPLGLKAMKELQTLNKGEDIITDDQAMLLALNTSSVNLIPFSVIAYRVAEGSKMPSDIILPTMIATSCSTIVAIIMTKVLQRFSTDPAAVGAEAQEIRDRILRELHAAAHGEEIKEEQR